MENKKTNTLYQWIKYENGCELPNEWEGVIVVSKTKTKWSKAIFTQNKFMLLTGQEIIPIYFMRIDVSNFNRENDGFIYKRK
jgi:hypothetical protein